eukprot:TRINITY_DN1006_c0_g1_i1.p1 TRINITY_DN1006_c0_g1~~TRINITY_DN1006_c0_g1_i1.p1  ORF type:complete len:125 (+),score=29.33 TRINITY_DN1006_c0_g1_i1:140-514(+)
MVADIGTLQRLGRVIGKGIAREMAFTGEPLGSERAYHFGLVNTVYPDKEKLLAGARALAQKIASNSSLVVQGTKLTMNYADEHSVEDSLNQVALWNTAFIKSPDLMEATLAFFEKRKPVFKSKL